MVEKVNVLNNVAGVPMQSECAVGGTWSKHARVRYIITLREAHVLEEVQLSVVREVERCIECWRREYTCEYHFFFGGR